MDLQSELQTYLSTIPDYRQSGKVLHSLSDIILTALFTFLSNGQDYEDMVLFGQQHGSSLCQYLCYRNGVPSSDTFSRVFRHIEPSVFYDLLVHYGSLFWALSPLFVSK